MLIFLALVVVPIIEIALFIEVGGAIGLWPTLIVVVLTALAGAALLRAQGFAALASLQARIDRGEDPSGVLAHGALILVAGLVLLTPGFFTDALGFLLLIPPVRRVLIRRLADRLVTVAMRRQAGRGPGRGSDPGQAPRPDARGETVEADYREVGDGADPDHAPSDRPASEDRPPRP